MVAGFDRIEIVHMGDDQENDLPAFVARKIGDLQADIAKLIATLNLLAPPARVRQYRRLTYLIVAWLIVLTVILIAHALLSAGIHAG